MYEDRTQNDESEIHDTWYTLSRNIIYSHVQIIA